MWTNKIVKSNEWKENPLLNHGHKKSCVFNEKRGTNGSFCALSYIWQRRERFSSILQLIKMTKLPSKFNYLLFRFAVLYSFGQKFSHYREGPWGGEEGLPQQFLVRPRSDSSDLTRMFVGWVVINCRSPYLHFF